MNSLLYEIYSGDYNLTPNQDKTQQEQEKKLYAELDKVQAALGAKFVDRLLELKAEQDGWRAFHYYQKGFQLGILLMLEALTPASG